jgi:hypothetical protein
LYALSELRARALALIPTASDSAVTAVCAGVLRIDREAYATSREISADGSAELAVASRDLWRRALWRLWQGDGIASLTRAAEPPAD